jgi:hypothetical protein
MDAWGNAQRRPRNVRLGRCPSYPGVFFHQTNPLPEFDRSGRVKQFGVEQFGGCVASFGGDLFLRIDCFCVSSEAPRRRACADGCDFLWSEIHWSAA